MTERQRDRETQSQHDRETETITSSQIRQDISYFRYNLLPRLDDEERKLSKQYEDLSLDDLEVLATLGMGGFGRVELVGTFELNIMNE